MFKKKFPTYLQLDLTDCGPTCLRIISKYYGKTLGLDFAREISNKTRGGTNLLGLSEAAESIGFKSIGAKVAFDDLLDNSVFPCIAFWDQIHFVVLYKIKNNKVYISDPGKGLLTYSYSEFKKYWTGNKTGEEGVVLILEPTSTFYDSELQGEEEKGKSSWRFILGHLFRYKRYLWHVFIGLIFGSLLQLAFPFLTQAIIDVGLAQHNIDLIYLILFAQLFVFIGSLSIDIIRRVILVHISSRINIHLLSDFFNKIFKLPISFYDTRVTGDLLQRINDHERIERFLTSGTLSILFSLFNIVIFSIVLYVYSTTVFLLFLTGSIIYVAWILTFAKQRSIVDYKQFNQLSENNDKNLELINGMQEIKLNGIEVRKRWEWEWMQVKLFKITLESLKIDNWQIVGSSLINELKNILITFYTAKLVLDGQLTLGMMLSIAYIIGQINVPLTQLLIFIQTLQDAGLSAKRIQDVYKKKEESELSKINSLPPEKEKINLDHLYFQYKGSRKGHYILNDISLNIPYGKTTAIVGASGSGKTTLLKLLLKFYEPSEGEIRIGNINLADIDPQEWRKQVGVVMQEGFMFSDTIANNIAATSDVIDFPRLIQASKIANIHDYIITLPMGYNSELGTKGIILSTGQQQRVLIARAVYKNPDYLFFDEATSALDAENERIITDNLDKFLAEKTAVIIAHRLSTVKNADQIIVLENGQIQEVGKHLELVKNRGIYYELIKNQLELGA